MEKLTDTSGSAASRYEPLRQGPAWSTLTAEYLRGLPQQIELMKADLRRRDFDSIKAMAHRVKGTSGTYRLDSISGSAARLEESAGIRNEDRVAAAIDEMRRVVQAQARRFGAAQPRPGDSVSEAGDE